jgi:hypothetical protein
LITHAGRLAITLAASDTLYRTGLLLDSFKFQEVSTMGTPKKKTVEFDAHKKVKKRVRVTFPTKDGTADFRARKPVEKKIHVKFKAKTTGRKSSRGKSR